MRPVGFRLRLALFFVATLVTVQLLTAVLVYEITRRGLIHEGEQQLAATAGAFVAQMDDISARVADNVEILSLDYALRSAIAERDQGTVLSVLRNHGRRVGASRMQLVGLDGAVQSDTGPDPSAGRPFPFPDLLREAYVRRTAAVVALEGRAYWMVVVPIYAPQPVGMVVVSIPLDNAMLAHVQQLSALPKDIELAARTGDRRWTVVAHGQGRPALAANFFDTGRALPLTPVMTTIDGREYLVLSQHLRQPRGSAPVVAVLGYSLDDALRPFRFVVAAWASLLALGLGVGLLGAWLTARSVSRPIEALAGSVRRIEAGDYEAPPDLRRDDEIGQLAGAFRAMTDAIRERESRILHQALHDAVTGLPNRRAAEAAIDDRDGASGPAEGALLMVGVTRLQDIIKTMGHAMGDRLLREAGRRIRLACPEGFLARVTDAQFAVWLDGRPRAGATEVAADIVVALGEPYREPDIAVDMVPSVGIAMAPADGDAADALLRHAEVAQFGAVGSPTGVAFYDAATDPHRPERLSLMVELREALDSGDMELYYQPKLDLAGRRIDGAEALIRWHHKRLGQVPPDTFIGMAEDTGNIQYLTRWVLASAVTAIGRWARAGHALVVAVNLSARDLEDPGLPMRIAKLLEQHRVPAASLTVEVTERAVIEDPGRAVALLRQVNALGVGVAIDDFGVGQSSFAYLRDLPATELKIDRLFIRELHNETGDRIIVQSIVELGHRLGCHITAEGVEHRGALDCLAAMGCDHAQGYLVAAPLPVARFDALLADVGDAAAAWS